MSLKNLTYKQQEHLATMLFAEQATDREEIKRLTQERERLKAEVERLRAIVAAMTARSCDSCKSYKSLSLLLGYCNRYKANIMADCCCKDWESNPLPENDRL